MSPARRHRLRIQALKAGAADIPAIAADVADTAVAIAAALEPRPVKLTLAAKKRMEREGVSSVTAANDNATEAEPPRAPSPDAVIRLQLAGDKRTIKAVKSQAAKAELKRKLLPAYDPWLAGVIAGVLAKRTQEPAFKGAQDDILVNAIIWRLDIGDLAEAFRLYDFAASNDWKLPEQFKRDLHTFVVEQSAEAANAEIKAGRRLSDPALGALLSLEKAVRERDMHDEVMAELYKAIGLELARRAEAVEGEGPIRKEMLVVAGLNLNEARRLNSRCGVTKAIEKLEREVKKLADATPAADPAPAATDAALLTELVVDGYRAELEPIDGGQVLIAFPAFPGFTAGATSQDLVVILAEAGKALARLIADRLEAGETVPPPDAPVAADTHEEQH